jgi:hypothetical protein
MIQLYQLVILHNNIYQNFRNRINKINRINKNFQTFLNNLKKQHIMSSLKYVNTYF